MDHRNTQALPRRQRRDTVGREGQRNDNDEMGIAYLERWSIEHQIMYSKVNDISSDNNVVMTNKYYYEYYQTIYHPISSS